MTISVFPSRRRRPIIYGMNTNGGRIAIFPGAFDPVTNGHVDVIERGRKLFDQLVVAVGNNPAKRHMFTQAERVEMLRPLLADMPNVSVDAYTGLTVDYASNIGAAAILRGLRSSDDVLREFQIALTNRAAAGVETVFIMTGAPHAFTSSRLIKQVAAMGGNVAALVPAGVFERIRAKAAQAAVQDAHLQES